MRWAVIWSVLIGLVLVPFFLFEPQFNAFAAAMTRRDTATWLASTSIFGLLAFDVFLPVPSSIVSTAAGVLLGFWRGAAIVWAGMMVACVIGYALGARASGLARRFVGEAGLERADRLLARYGDWTIVVCRPVPVLAEASVIFAGLVATTVSSLCRAHGTLEPRHRRRLRRLRRLLDEHRLICRRLPRRARDSRRGDVAGEGVDDGWESACSVT